MSNTYFRHDSDLEDMNNRCFYLRTGLGTGLLLSCATFIVTQASLSAARAQSTPRSFTCTTDGYSAQIRWQGRQPQLTFGGRSNPPELRNTPVEELSQRSIVTYTTQQGETKTIVFVYSDGTCAVTVTSVSGETTVNELGQISYEDETVSPSSPTPDETIVSFQTSSNAVRIFTRNGETLMNIFNKQQQITWINGVPVKKEQTPEGTHYTNTRGEARVEVFLNLNGDRILVINGVSEAGY